MELYLVRHIKPDFTEGTCYGQTDLLLPAHYQEAHQAIRSRLPKEADAVYSSPLQRCTLLAEMLSSHYKTDPRLMELHFGAWEGMLWNDIAPDALHQWMDDYIHQSPPGGESLTALSNRFRSFMEELRLQPFKKVIIICHAGIIHCAMHYFNGVPLNQIMMEKVDFGGIYSFYTKT